MAAAAAHGIYRAMGFCRHVFTLFFHPIGLLSKRDKMYFFRG